MSKKIDNKKILESIINDPYSILDGDLDETTIDELLRMEGASPEKIGINGKELALSTIEAQRLSWTKIAENKIELMNQAIGITDKPQKTKISRSDMIFRIKSFETNGYSAMHRNRKKEESSDEELLEMLEEFEELEALAKIENK